MTAKDKEKPKAKLPKPKGKLTKARAKVDKEPAKNGRPTKYTPEMAERICELVATTDMGYTRISDMYPDLPVRVTVNIWRRRYPEFRAKYAQAKCEQIEFMTEEILEIADDATNDWMEHFSKDDDSLGWRVNGEHIQRSRVRIDTRKWLAAKLVPRIYGDAKPEDTANAIHEDAMERKRELDEKNKKEF